MSSSAADRAASPLRVLSLRVVRPVRVGDHDDLVDARTGDRAQRAQQDRLAGQAQELLGKIGAKTAPAATRQDDSVGAHAPAIILAAA